METIISRGKEYKQIVESFDCTFCPYKVDCEAWACVSAKCEITNECFNCNITGTWCPFDKEHNSVKTRKS
jgi:hypothetical protein